MPNVQVFYNGETYYGVVIILNHGTSICWDGRVIRHCTSITNVTDGNHVFGTFWAGKSKVVKARLEEKTKSYYGCDDNDVEMAAWALCDILSTKSEKRNG